MQLLTLRLKLCTKILKQLRVETIIRSLECRHMILIRKEDWVGIFLFIFKFPPLIITWQFWYSLHFMKQCLNFLKDNNRCKDNSSDIDTHCKCIKSGLVLSNPRLNVYCTIEKRSALKLLQLILYLSWQCIYIDFCEYVEDYTFKKMKHNEWNQ